MLKTFSRIRTFILPAEVPLLNDIINRSNVTILDKQVFPNTKAKEVIVYLEYEESLEVEDLEE